MSIIRQRTKNLLFAGLCGILIGLLATVGMYFFQEQRMAQMVDGYESQVQTLEETIDIAQEEEVKVIATSRQINPGEPFNESMFMEISVPISLVPSEVLASTEGVLGKTALTMIPSNTIMIEGFLAKVMTLNENTKIREFDKIDLPMNLNKDDLLDIRIAFPTGEDFVVLSQKKVYEYGYALSENETDHVTLALNEEELIRMTSSYVDKNLYQANLYGVIYQYPLESPKSELSYPVNMAVLGEMAQNPNMNGTLAQQNVALYRKVLDQNLSEFFDEDGIAFINAPIVKLPTIGITGSTSVNGPLVEGPQSTNPVGINQDNQVNGQSNSSENPSNQANTDTAKTVPNTAPSQGETPMIQPGQVSDGKAGF